MAKINYKDDKQFFIKPAFTALNGAFETYEVKANVSLFVEPARNAEGELDLDEKGELKNAKEVNAAQNNLLRVLEVLRSNGAQPVVTRVTDDTLVFSVEQSWTYGSREVQQVSKRSPKADAVKCIEDLFKGIKDVDGKGELVSEGNVEFLGTIGNLVAAEKDDSSAS